MDLKDEDLLEQFKLAHESHLPFEDAETEERLFLACLVNLEGLSKELSHQGPSYVWPMLNLFKIRSSLTLLKLVKMRSDYLDRLKVDRTWWHFLYKYLPGIPNGLAWELLSLIEEKGVLSYVLTCIRVNQLGRGFPVDIEFKSLDLIELSFIIKRMLEDPEKEDAILIRLEQQRFQDMDAVHVAKIALIEKIQILSVDQWLSLAETSTNHLDPSVTWWPLELGQIPSNQQLLIAHYCYQICQFSEDLKPVLANFARKYKKEYELSLNNLDLDEILNQLEQPELEPWRMKAFIRHLINEMFEDILKNKRALQVLAKYPEEFVNDIDKLFDRVQIEQKPLVLSIMKSCDLSKVHELLRRELAKELPEDQPCTDQEKFDQDLRIFLNKAVISDETEQEWLIMVFQHPPYAVQTLVQEAMRNPGKITLACELILKLPHLGLFRIPEQILIDLEHATDDTIANFIIVLSQGNEDLAQDFFDGMMKMITITEHCALKCLEIMVKIKSKVKINDDHLMALSALDQALILKQTRTILDGRIQSLLHELVQDQGYINEKELLYNLAWLKPHQWQDLSINDVIDKVIILLDFLQDDHKAFLLQNLSQIIANAAGDIISMSIHDKVVLLITMYPYHAGLQNCQIGILSKILEQEKDPDYRHLVSVIASLPAECEAKKLSLTKLKMILDLIW